MKEEDDITTRRSLCGGTSRLEVGLQPFNPIAWKHLGSAAEKLWGVQKSPNYRKIGSK